MTPLSAGMLAREAEGMGLAMTAGSATLLRYSILPDPNPMQVSAEHARLILVVSNPGTNAVACTKIEVTLPVGTTARSLIPSAAFQTTPPPGWSAGPGGVSGAILLTPDTPAAGVIGMAGLAVEIAGLTINAEPGVATVTVEETASRQGAPEQARLADIEVAKFPRQFQVGGLLADPLEVPYDGTCIVAWSGSPASYTLKYQAAEGSRTIEGLPPAGSHAATHLVSFPCVFTLVVKVTVAGLDTPLTLQRQISVSAAPRLAITSFEASATTATAAVPLTFGWQTQHAKTVTLRIARGDGSVDVSGVRGCTLTLAPTDGKRFDVAAPDGAKLGTIGLPAAVEGSLTIVLSASDGVSSVQATFDVVARPVRVSLDARNHGYMGWSIGWNVADSAGDVELRPLGKVDPGGPPGGYKLVPTGTYTLTANGFWGPARQTRELR